jgi:hypothetical protein
MTFRPQLQRLRIDKGFHPFNRNPQRSRARFRALRHNHQPIFLAVALSFPRIVSFGIHPTVQINPDILINSDADSEWPRLINLISDSNYKNPFRRDKHFPMALKRLRALAILLESQINLEKTGGDIEAVTKSGYLHRLQFFPISALQAEGKMPMPLFIPPVLVGQIRHVL